MYTIEELSISDIEVSKINPRFTNTVINEEIAISELIKLNPQKMYLLVKEISEQLLPILFYLVKYENELVLMDGNRRLTAMKILKTPSLIPVLNSTKDLIDFCEKNQNCNLPEKIPCVIYEKYTDSLLEVLERLHVQDESKANWTPLAQYNMSQRLGGNKHKWMKSLLYYYSDVDEINKMTLNNADKYSRFFAAMSLEKIIVCDDGKIGCENGKEALDFAYSLFKNKTLDTRKTTEEYRTWVKKIFNSEEELPAIDSPSYTFSISNNRFFEMQKFSINQLGITIRDKNKKIIKYDIKDLSISFTSPNDSSEAVLDTNIKGKWKLTVEYDGVSESFDVEVIDRIEPFIELASAKATIQLGETCQLRKLILDARNGFNESQINLIKITSGSNQNIEIINDVFTDRNLKGLYSISYRFVDVDKTPCSKVLILEVVDKIELPLFGSTQKNKLLSYELGMTVNITQTVNRLINEINSLDIKEFPCVIACSCRSLIELSFEVMVEKKLLNFSKNFDQKLQGIKDALLNKGIEEISKNEKLNCFKSRNQERNFLQALNISTMNALLNQGAHTSTKVINIESLEECVRKEVAHLLALISAWIN